MNKKIIISFIFLSLLLIFFSSQFVFYFKEYNLLKRMIESKLDSAEKKQNIYEKIILQYEYMDFKIFAFEKKYPQFAKIVHHSFEEAKKNEISPYTVLSVIQVESNFDPLAKSNVATGLMQINVDVWKDYFKIDEKKIFDIQYNIALGCKILRHYLEKSNRDLSKALYLYNNGYVFHNEKYVPRVKLSAFFRK